LDATQLFTTKLNFQNNTFGLIPAARHSYWHSTSFLMPTSYLFTHSSSCCIVSCMSLCYTLESMQPHRRQSYSLYVPYPFSVEY